jgi:hypothetical protein
VTLRVILFGASGMVGGSILPTVLADPEVEAVLAVGRSSCGASHPKLKELLLPDLKDFSAVQEQLRGYNACLYTLGATVAGKTEAQYAAINYDLPVAAGKALSALNPGMGFAYVSGMHTDSTEQGKVLWARVKGKTENALLAMPFGPVAMIRLAALKPAKGIRSKTLLYRVFYSLMGFLLPVIELFAPDVVISAPQLARAMLKAVRGQAGKKILEPADLKALGRD